MVGIHLFLLFSYYFASDVIHFLVNSGNFFHSLATISTSFFTCFYAVRIICSCGLTLSFVLHFLFFSSHVIHFLVNSVNLIPWPRFPLRFLICFYVFRVICCCRNFLSFLRFNIFSTVLLVFRRCFVPFLAYLSPLLPHLAYYVTFPVAYSWVLLINKKEGRKNSTGFWCQPSA